MLSKRGIEVPLFESNRPTTDEHPFINVSRNREDAEILNKYSQGFGSVRRLITGVRGTKADILYAAKHDKLPPKPIKQWLGESALIVSGSITAALSVLSHLETWGGKTEAWLGMVGAGMVGTVTWWVEKGIRRWRKGEEEYILGMAKHLDVLNPEEAEMKADYRKGKEVMRYRQALGKAMSGDQGELDPESQALVEEMTLLRDRSLFGDNEAAEKLAAVSRTLVDHEVVDIGNPSGDRVVFKWDVIRKQRKERNQLIRHLLDTGADFPQNTRKK